MYLLSFVEIYGDNCGNSDTITTNETKQLDYYENIQAACDNYSHVRKTNGNNAFYWLRSAVNNNSAFYRITDAGYASSAGSTITHGVSPAFRIG